MITYNSTVKPVSMTYDNFVCISEYLSHMLSQNKMTQEQYTKAINKLDKVEVKED